MSENESRREEGSGVPTGHPDRLRPAPASGTGGLLSIVPPGRLFLLSRAWATQLCASAEDQAESRPVTLRRAPSARRRACPELFGEGIPALSSPTSAAARNFAEKQNREGHEFTRATSATKISPASAAEGNVPFAS